MGNLTLPIFSQNHIKYVTLEWQNRLPWMRLDNESMPLLAYDQLRVKKLTEDEVRVECYDNAMTGEFSQFDENSVLLAHDQLKFEKKLRVRSGSNTLTAL